MNSQVISTPMAPRRPSFLAQLRIWTALSRSRRQLRRLTADRLADLGLSENQARREAQRPFWDVPDHWQA